MVGRLVATLLLFIGSSRASAQARRVDAKTYAAALAAWRACFPSESRAPEFPTLPDVDDPNALLDVRRGPAGFRVYEHSGGMGVEAVYAGMDMLFQPQGCHALWATDESYDGALAIRMRIGWANRGAPTDREVQLIAAEPARPDDPRHAFARAWLSHACAGGPDSELAWNRPIEGPIAPAQLWHAGVPARSPATFWPVSLLDSIGVHAALRPSDDDEELSAPAGPEIAGIMVPKIGRPTKTFSAVDVDVLEAEIPGRNGGKAIALHERVANRYRWVVVTRGCVQGTTVKWVGTIGARLVGVTRSRHGRYAEGDAVLIIDVPSGTAWAVRLPEVIRDAVVEDNERDRASLKGTVLDLRRGTEAATIDLGPMFALIPAHAGGQ